MNNRGTDASVEPSGHVRHGTKQTQTGDVPSSSVRLPLDNQINYIIRPDSVLVDWQATYTNKLSFLFSESLRGRSSPHGDYASPADLNGSKCKQFHPHLQPPHGVLTSLCLVLRAMHCTCQLCRFGRIGGVWTRRDAMERLEEVRRGHLGDESRGRRVRSEERASRRRNVWYVSPPLLSITPRNAILAFSHAIHSHQCPPPGSVPDGGFFTFSARRVLRASRRSRPVSPCRRASLLRVIVSTIVIVSFFLPWMCNTRIRRKNFFEWY